MIVFDKNITAPPLLAAWSQQFATSINTAIQQIEDEQKTASQVWEELGTTFGQVHPSFTHKDTKAIKQELITTLYQEQGGLCCYCGDTIDLNKTWHSLEHWAPKVKHPKQIFEYHNLMLSCKESKRLTYFTVGKSRIGGQLIQTLEDVAQATNLPVDFVRQYNPDFNPSTTTKIHVPQPPHCDDSKSKNDSKNSPDAILNPTQDQSLIGQFRYRETGEIFFEKNKNKNNLLSNSVRVLALNCETLVIRRQEKWIDAVMVFESDVERDLMQIVEEEAIALDVLIQELIQGKSTPDSNGLLEPFYFVEVAFYKNLLGL